MFENYTANGALAFRVATAQEALPVADVTIYIKAKGTERILAVLYTNTDGITTPFPLPAPEKAISLFPGGENPYSEYSVETRAKGYYTNIIGCVPVFAETTSVQYINMIPYAAYDAKNTRPEDNILLVECVPQKLNGGR